MRNVVIVCANGVATSSHLATRVRAHLQAVGIPARVEQATVMDLLSSDFHADLIVSTVEIPPSLGIPVVSGMPLLLRTNPTGTYADLERFLRERPRSGHGTAVDP
jgi:PTS system galactitol-specific IIB component